MKEVGGANRPVNVSAGCPVDKGDYQVRKFNAFISRLKHGNRRFHGVAAGFIAALLGRCRKLDRMATNGIFPVRNHTLCPSLIDLLRQRLPQVFGTKVLIAVNCLVFLAMFANGAGLWHSPNGVQLAWGANFGPATQDGEWWRLVTALFLHFGALHLFLNMWALWDVGQLVERMYGPMRFASIYFLSGISGNLLSLVCHRGHAVSGGASGAIFGVYGALLIWLWRERRHLHPHEFRWLFGGAAGFATVTIVLGLLIPGIDNAAHCGGLLGGMLSGIGLARTFDTGKVLSWHRPATAGAIFALSVLLLIRQISAPDYRWSEETMARREISKFIKEDAAIALAWQDIVNESMRGNSSFDELARRIDVDIGDRYEESFEHLSKLSPNPALPSAGALATLRQYAVNRKDASRLLANGLRSRDPDKINNGFAMGKLANQASGQAPRADN